MEYFILGIDTSNYTSSMAIINQNKEVIIDNRKMLNVEEGQRGLRQSEALFQHVLNMPLLFKDTIVPSVREKIKYVSVSNRPRPIEDSYMPVFLASKSFGQVVASTLGCKYMEFSHQENHIEAAKWSSGFIDNDESFIGVHLSGGTSEILKVKKLNHKYSIEIIGGSLDISAGQLIDRLGVKLGYSFPAGKFIDDIAMKAVKLVSLPIAVNEGFFNFSGLETKAYQLLNKGHSENEVVKSIMDSIARTIGISLKNVCKENDINKVLCFGGVASSKYIHKYLMEFSKENNFTIFFGKEEYCTDNAIGTALLPLSFNKEGEL